VPMRRYKARVIMTPRMKNSRRRAPQQRRRVDITPSGFASVLMTGRIISEKLPRRCALRVTILQRSLPPSLPEKENLIRGRCCLLLYLFADVYSLIDTVMRRLQAEAAKRIAIVEIVAIVTGRPSDRKAIPIRYRSLYKSSI